MHHLTVREKGREGSKSRFAAASPFSRPATRRPPPQCGAFRYSIRVSLRDRHWLVEGDGFEPSVPVRRAKRKRAVDLSPPADSKARTRQTSGEEGDSNSSVAGPGAQIARAGGRRSGRLGLAGLLRIMTNRQKHRVLRAACPVNLTDDEATKVSTIKFYGHIGQNKRI